AHTVRHGQGRTAWRERLETEGVGMSGLTTSDQYGTAEPGRHYNRQDFQADSINAVVVRKRQGKDYGLGGKTVFLSHASVAQPLQPLFGVGVGFLCGSRPAEERVRVSVPEPAPN